VAAAGGGINPAAVVSGTGRPAPALTAVDAAALMRATRNAGDRLLLRVLIDHDSGEDDGSYPGVRRMAELTGWSEKTVLHRLTKLRKAGRVVSRKHGVGMLVSYFVLSPDIPTYRDDGTSRHTGTSRHPDIEGGHDIPLTSRHVGHSILRGTTTTSLRGARARSGRTATPSDNWLAPYLQAWKDRYGGAGSAGQLARHLRPVEAEHGSGRTLRAWTAYLAQTEARFANASRFATTFGSWGGNGTRGGGALAVEEV